MTVAATSNKISSVLGIPENCIQIGDTVECCLRHVARAGLYTDNIVDTEHNIRQRLDWYFSEKSNTITMVHSVSGERYLKVTRSPIGAHGMVVLLVDITEHVKIEAALTSEGDKLRHTLEDLLAAQANLVESEKLASIGRLVADATHEINTPLGVVVTISSLFAEKLSDITARFRNGGLLRSELEHFINDANEICELLQRNIHRSADLVSSLKRVAADQISEYPRTFLIGTCLSDIVTTLQPLWRRPGHRVDVICPESIESDGFPGIISQIVTNLITNSIVHGFNRNNKGIITLSARLVDHDDVEICYTDNGKGISPDAQARIYEPFFTTRRSLGSTGLGLHIVRSLVTDRLNGSIDLDSSPGQGVRFTIRFPRVHRP
jgi:signal transduction histidine kinase